MIPLDLAVEMYLKPVSTGVYDWVTVDGVRRGDFIVNRGLGNLNNDPGPGRMSFSVNDEDGNFNRRNPMGDFYGSIGLGVQTRALLLRVDDQFGRTETNTWGATGNEAGDSWTNGTSTGGTVNATDWSVSSGSARHSVPVDAAYRVSELSKTTRLFTDCEVRLRIKVPTNNVTGTGALSTDVWFRATDVSNFVGVSLAFQVDETLQVAFYDRTAGTNRYLLRYTTIPGLSLSSSVDYDLRCQVEGSTLRAKVWPVGDPEPQDWQVTASRAVVREGYTAVASYVYSGNSNSKPLVFEYPEFQARLPLFTGEITALTPTGDDKTEPKVTAIAVADIMERIQSGSTPSASVMRRGRAAPARWFHIGSRTANGGSTSTFTIPTSSVGSVQVGDFFSLETSTGARKDDAIFTITGTSVAGANTSLLFSPDAYDTVVSGDVAVVYRSSAPASLPVAYWPCEDGDQATQISSGLVGGAPMAISGATPNFGAESGFPCSAPILQINDAELVASIPDYTDTNQAFTIVCLLAMPDTDEGATSTDLLQFYTSGTGYSWDLQYQAAGDGSLQLKVFNSASTLLYDSGAIDFELRGDKCQITLYVEQVGGTVTYGLYRTSLDGSTGGVAPTTVTGVSVLGKCLMVRVNPAGGYDNVAFGHLAVVPDVWDSNITLSDVIGWSGQSALLRFLRLCNEENIPSSYHVDWDLVTTEMGAQKVDRMANLLKQPAISDGGFIYGPRGDTSLEIRSRGSLTNQSAMAEFSIADGEVLPPFDPVDDHADTHNYVSVTRVDGTTAVAENTTGPLSTQLPPNGLGRRDQGYTLSLASDDQAQDHADWRLGLGTVDQYRAPRFTVTPAGATTVGVEKLMSITIGSRVDITDLSSKDIYDTLPQLVLGYTLRLDKFFPVLEMNCAPYELYRAFALTDDGYSRPDGYDSVTNATLTTAATSMSVASQSGLYLWTTDAADLPFNVVVSGEVMQVTAISGATSPQTFTVVRSINGVVKTHAAGEPVEIADENYWNFR